MDLNNALLALAWLCNGKYYFRELREVHNFASYFIHLSSFSSWLMKLGLTTASTQLIVLLFNRMFLSWAAAQPGNPVFYESCGGCGQFLRWSFCLVGPWRHKRLSTLLLSIRVFLVASLIIYCLKFGFLMLVPTDQFNEICIGVYLRTHSILLRTKDRIGWSSP